MNNGHKPIGVLAIQGDFAMHVKALERIGAPCKLVKHASEIAGVSGLIMPGGESTTMLKLFANDGLGDAIRKFVMAGNPVFGTCAGAILLAREVLNPSRSVWAFWISPSSETLTAGKSIAPCGRASALNLRTGPWRWSLSARRLSAGWAKACASSGDVMACPCWSSRAASLQPRSTPN